MTARQQWVVAAVIVACLAGGVWGATYFLGDELQQVTVGTRAPAFRAMTLDATPVRKTLADYKGQVVLLNVWATWCGPCRVEMPSIEQLHRALGPKGLHVVAISIDQPGKQDDIREFVKQFGLTFEVLHDPDDEVGTLYRTTGTPETFVIGRDGLIRKLWIGQEDWNSESNRRLIEQLLAEPSS
jgi:cytochrome c biogenesis protein CcmG/thiol:disulfide interchange protein DsbE